jgi:hypothetical protein
MLFFFADLFSITIQNIKQKVVSHLSIGTKEIIDQKEGSFLYI